MSRYDDEIDDHMRRNENPGTSNQPPMPDTMKGLLDELEKILRHNRACDWDVQRQLANLRTAVEKMGHEATLGVGDGSGNLFVHGSYDSIKQCQALILSGEKAERERDELRGNALAHEINIPRLERAKKLIPNFSGNIIDALCDENTELKRTVRNAEQMYVQRLKEHETDTANLKDKLERARDCEVCTAVEDENTELKRRLEGEHDHGCDCRVNDVDPRCLALREIKKEE